MSSDALQTYSGSCHCGAFRFNVKLPELKKVTACNCSICSKKAYLWVFPVKEMEVEKGEEALSEYQFGPKKTTFKFCRICGTAVNGVRHDVPEGQGVGINARTLKDVDIWSLEVDTMDGASFKPAYKPPTYPTEDLKGGEQKGLKTYTGSCHCGCVMIAVESKPLAEVKVLECDCSICGRNGTNLIYPDRSSVTVHGEDSLTCYQFGKKENEHKFCKVCGVPMFIEEPPDTRAVNVKVLDGVEWKDLKVVRDRGSEA